MTHLIDTGAAPALADRSRSDRVATSRVPVDGFVATFHTTIREAVRSWECGQVSARIKTLLLAFNTVFLAAPRLILPILEQSSDSSRSETAS
ncbi:hypothetical protein HTG_02610 [Natrinema mahii]|nr:hypothetical protein HTG_02610 [Natrinema mahii]